jgi:AraC family transcriptional regulator, arabinose operon regulatory protein
MSDGVQSVERADKGEGFAGQRIVVLPRSVVARAEQHPLMTGIIPTDVGHFPHATGHLRERLAGVDQAIFIYCTKGAGWCELSGGYYPIKRGELLVVPPETGHVYVADEQQPWSIYWFHAKGSLLPAFLLELDISVESPVVRIGDDPQLLALFEELLDVVAHGYTTLQLLYASQTLAHLIAAMIRDHRNMRQERPASQQKIAHTIAYMKQHLNQSLQLDALAALANLSRSCYVDLFKQQTGHAPIDYFIRLRMHRACQLLDTTDASIKAVATELGYEDALYFTRVFRAVVEMAPTAYRRMRKG